MNTKELAKILSAMEINFDSISFYQTKLGETLDTEFGTCGISGEQGDLVDCMALDFSGNVVEFQALESLVGGSLGKIAGAF